MIHLKIGKPSHPFTRIGYTLEVKEDLMMIHYKQYHSIIVNNAHKYPNLAVFARLCKQSNILINICGLRNKYTEEVLQDADVMMVY